MQKISNSRVLVTGGAGFIGSNLVEFFLKQNNEVVCLDNFSTGEKENISEFLNNKNFILIEGDIRDLKICLKACDGIDFVFHEAAIGSVPRSIQYPIIYYENNTMGTVNILEASRVSKIKRIVYATSSSVYGDNASLPKQEDNIGKQLSPYGVAKYSNELFADNYTRLYGLETIGLRYFNVFGKKQDPLGAYAAVIPKFAISLIKHECPIINGDGSYSRDFTYIDNVVQANELAALVPFSKLPTITHHPSTIFNIAYGEQTTLNNLFSILKESLSKYDKKIEYIEPVYGPNREGDIPHSLADISKARNLLEYNPKYSVKDGLSLIVEWYWNHLKTHN